MTTVAGTLPTTVWFCREWHSPFGLLGQEGLDRLPIEPAVGLGSRAAHGRSLAAVEDPELDAAPVDRPGHDPVQRIDLADQVTLAEASDRGVAGHGPDGVAAMGDERRPGAHPGCRGRRFRPGMAAADHHNVVDHEFNFTPRMFHVKHPLHFPMQKVRNRASRTSSTSMRPVSRPSA